jgi:site-specific recombinase XerD
VSEAARELHQSESWLGAVGPAFERSLLRAGRSPATVHTYMWTVDKLLDFLQRAGLEDLSEVTRDHLERWQDEILQSRLKARSRQHASSIARALLRWAADREIIDWRLERAIVPVKVKRTKRRPIPREDLAKILAYILPRRPHMSLVELRDRALFVYLLVTGARVTEALQAKRTDYIAPIVIQKGGGEKQLRTTSTALALIHDYLRARHDDSLWLWIKHGNNINAAGDRLESSGVREAWIRLALKLQIPQFTTHQVRHSTATVLANANVSPAAIADHLGHADLRTVMQYIEVEEPLRLEIDNVLEGVIRQPRPPLPPAPRRSWRDYRR